MRNNGPVRTMLAQPTVMEMLDIRSKVTKEIDRQKGFLRFMENSEGVLYAPYSPDNDITDLLAPHFAERFKNQRFVIHDIKRKIAGMYDGINLVMFEAENAEIYLSEYEKTFENLWKQYYNSVNISSRPHEKQMKGYMPVRYWKFLPEKNGRND
jgi:probable DNA metabolism protein